jgi:tRNA A37 methylthiotransferase MiaB
MSAFKNVQGEYIHHLNKERNLSEHTIRAYLGDLESFLSHLEKQKVDDVSQQTIAHIRSWLANQQVKGGARNEVDSEELAGRLAADGWTLVSDVESAEVAVVNTCGFIESAKKDSVDALLEANSLKGHGKTRAVVAVGCTAERYGKELAEALREADVILGFDDYQDISECLQSIISGNAHTPHTPRDRRALLPIAPVERAAARDESYASSLAAGGSLFRKRLGDAPWAPLKIASGCDRRCSLCAIPYFRGSFISSRPTEVLQEGAWLAQNGVSELFLVSENTTSYGKDLGDLKLMEKILHEFAEIEGIERVRLSYLQPAEMRPSLLQAMRGYSLGPVQECARSIYS